MKNLLRRVPLSFLLLCVVALTATGCAHESITLASGTGLSDDQVAILRRDPNDGAGGPLSSFLNGVVDLRGREIVLKSQGFGDYREIKVAPGTYEVMIKSYAYQKIPAFPRVRLEVRAGHTYYFRGVPIMDASAVRVEYRVEKTALDAAGKALPAPERRR